MGGYSELKDMIYQGQYEKANERCHQLLNSDLPSKLDVIKILNYQSNIEVKMGNLDRALEIAKKSLDLTFQTKNQFLQFKSMKQKIEVLLKMHDLTALDTTFTQFKTYDLNSINLTENQRLFIKATIFHFSGAIEKAKGNFSLAKNEYLKSLDISSNSNEIELIAMTLNHLGITSEYLGKNEDAIEFYQRSLFYFKKTGYLSFISGVLMNLGLIYRQMGKLKESLNSNTESMAIAENMTDKSLIGALNTNLGLVQIDLGNLDKAENYLKEGLRIFKEIKFERGAILAYINLGIVYYFRWEFDKSFGYYDEAKTLAQKLNDDVNLSRIIHNRAQVLRSKGDYKSALLNFKHALEINKQLQNPLVMGQIYYELIVTSTIAKAYKDAKLYLEGFENLVQSEDNLKLNILYQLAKATLLKDSVELENQIEAKKILEEILKTEELEYEMIMEAVPKLCEILVKEYQWTKSQIVIDQINQQLDRLTNISSKSPSYIIKVEVALLKSRTALILDDPTSAINELNQAQDLAETNELAYLLARVTREKSFLENHIFELKKITEKAATMLDLNKKFTDEYLDYINKEFRPFSADI